MLKNKKCKLCFVLFFITLFFVIGAGFLVLWNYYTTEPEAEVIVENIFNFEECLAAGHPIMESYPRKCRTSNGKVFIEEIEIPETAIIDDGPVEAEVKPECIITGCNAHICAEEEVITTCEFRPDYACFKDAECTRQEDGKCGWTLTAEMFTCLNRDIEPAVKSGIIGTITLGPICPVIIQEKEDECKDRSYQAEVIIMSEDGVREIRRFTSSLNGNFNIELDPGIYILDPFKYKGSSA